MKQRQLIRELQIMGWVIIRQNSSHIILGKVRARLVVSCKNGEEVGRKLQAKIFKQARGLTFRA